MAQASGKYEVMYIIDADKNEEERTALMEKFKALAEEHGTVSSCEAWGGGERKLRYPINKKTTGFYVLMQFESTPAFPAELDRVLKITDGIVRSMITVAH